MRTLSRPALAILGLGVGAFCLWLALRKVDWAQAGAVVRSADAKWIALGVALQGANLVLRAVRWRGLLLFRWKVGFGPTLEAGLTGYAMNGALPARLGELFRADYFGHLTGLRMSGVLASIFVERLLDLMAAVSLLALGLALAGTSTARARDAALLGAAIAAVVAAGLWFVSSRLASGNAEAWLARATGWLPRSDAMARAVGPPLERFAEGARVIGSPCFVVAALLTLPIWTIEATALWAICRSVQVELGVIDTAFLMGGAALSTLLPTAPGFLGSYQYAFVLLLAGLGVGATTAVIAATMAQIFLIGLYVLVGFLVLGIATAVRARHSRNVPR